MPETAKKAPERMPLVAEADFAGRQIVGKRANQEDSYGVVPPGDLGGGPGDLLAVLADGMGGHAAGEVASSLALATFAERFFSAEALEDAARMWDALEAANKRIAGEIDASNGKLAGMGTTLVGLLVRGAVARWISVGDSPLYLVRDGRAQRLNEIHSFRANLEKKVRDGVMSEAEMREKAKEPDTLMSALIGDELYEVDDPAPLDLLPGDWLLATSDGVNTLPAEELAAVVAEHAGRDASEVAEAILDAVRAKKRANQDNATVVAVRVPPDSPAS